MPRDDMFKLNLGLSPTAWLFVVLTTILVAGSCWIIFEKANVAGWKCLIPFYSSYCEFKIAWGCGWKFLYLLFPFVNIVVMIKHIYKLSKAFGYGGGFAVGLLFFPAVFYPILAFGTCKYVGPQK